MTARAQGESRQRQAHPMHAQEANKNAYSSFSTIGAKDKLPNRPLVRACIAGCRGSAKDIERWDQAHAQLSLRLDRQAGH